jgi:glycosyltransferase involved in cell wall biosynthesis
MAFLLRWAAKLYRIPIVLQVGIDWSAYNKQMSNPWKRAVKDHIKKQSLKDAAAVIALAHHLKAPVEAYGKSPEVLYPFIETEAYPFQSRKRGHRLRLLFIGRLAPVKGARYLIDSLPLVLKERSDFHVQIVGGSLPGRRSDEPYIRSRIEDYGLHDHVSLVGQVPHSRVVDYLKDADLVVMPSETEGFHYALLEAWACGVPVLATDIPFHREVIDGDVGRLCAFSPQSMAGGILEFLAMSEDRLLRMKHAARRKVEDLNRESRGAWREFFRNRVFEPSL